MKLTKNFFVALLACSAALVGCDWGGVSSDESWSDAYSWANFTGNFKLVTEVTTSGGSTAPTVNNSKTFSYSSGRSEYPTAQANLTPGTVTVAIGSYNLKDDGAGNLTSVTPGLSGSVKYTTGVVAISVGFAVAEGTAVKITYSYTGTAPLITSINVNQKGNLLTMTDNRGTSYSGKITGASCPTVNEGGYTQAGQVRFSFEVAANDGSTISGSLSGDWSGSSTAKSGVLSNRVMDATYNDGKSTSAFQAASGSVEITPKPIVPGQGTM